MRIHVADPAAFSGHFRAELLRRRALTDDISKAEALFIRVETRVDAKLLRRAPRLRVVVSPTTGVDHLDLEACRAAGVHVITLRGRTGFLRNLPNTAEHAFALLLSLQRRVPSALASVQAGRWSQSEFRGRTLRGMTFGIVGFGRLGRIAAGLARGFGMSVVAYDPYVADYPRSVRRARTLRELARSADVVSVHASLTPETTNLIDAGFFAAMKPTAVLVNTARGRIVDEAALLAALKAGRIAGAALDVLAAEPAKPRRDDPLIRHSLRHGNLVITPHIGGQTEEAVRAADTHCLALLDQWTTSHEHD